MSHKTLTLKKHEETPAVVVVPTDEQIREFLERERVRKADETSAANGIDWRYDAPVESKPFDWSKLQARDPSNLRSVPVQAVPPRVWGNPTLLRTA